MFVANRREKVDIIGSKWDGDGIVSTDATPH